MSNTPKLPDECKKLLDAGWRIVLYKNQLGSYTAVGVSAESAGPIIDALEVVDPDPECKTIGRLHEGYCITDDFEPSQVLYRLTEKVFGNIV